jgi:hypothetical protein
MADIEPGLAVALRRGGTGRTIVLLQGSRRRGGSGGASSRRSSTASSASSPPTTTVAGTRGGGPGGDRRFLVVMSPRRAAALLQDRACRGRDIRHPGWTTSVPRREALTTLAFPGRSRRLRPTDADFRASSRAGTSLPSGGLSLSEDCERLVAPARRCRTSSSVRRVGRLGPVERRPPAGEEVQRLLGLRAGLGYVDRHRQTCIGCELNRVVAQGEVADDA